MLHELRQLSQSLLAARVPLDRQDDHLVAYPRGKPLFRVALDEKGNVCSVAPVDDSVARALLKYEVSKGGDRESAPGFNVPPLFVAPHALPHSQRFAECLKATAKQWKKGSGNTPTSRQRDLDTLVAHCQHGWMKKRRAIEGCLRKAADTLLSAICGAGEIDLERLRPLIELLRRQKLLTMNQLRDGVIRATTELIITGATDPTGLDSLIRLFFTKDAALMLELAEDGGTPANQPSVWAIVNKVLLFRERAPQAAAVNEGSVSTTDLFGEPWAPTTEPMPERRLPRLGNVKLRSNAASRICQTRYGLIENDSCAVGADARASLASALAWLTAAEREGKTFRDISNSCGFPFPVLLLAFPDPLPAEPAAYADMFAAPTDDDLQPGDEARFIAAAEQVSKQLQSPSGMASDAVVRVFAVGKRPGDARTKLLISREFSAARIMQAAQEWQSAAHNLPVICLRQFGADRQPHRVCCDRIPSPAQVGRCLNMTWLRARDDLASSMLSAFDFGSELTLFLGFGGELAEIAGRALRLAVAQWPQLLTRVGEYANRGIVYPRWPAEQLLLPSILGLLLAKLGSWKEVYMNDVPYWIGRLLSVADRFHLYYCRTERKGDIPAGPLIGNATMPTAVENPRTGLARLAERLPLYQRVADEKLRREAAEVTSHIDPTKLSERATDQEKAQMLLGYLARPDLLEPV